MNKQPWQSFFFLRHPSGRIAVFEKQSSNSMVVSYHISLNTVAHRVTMPTAEARSLYQDLRQRGYLPITNKQARAEGLGHHSVKEMQ